MKVRTFLAILCIVAGAAGFVWYQWQEDIPQLLQDGSDAIEQAAESVNNLLPLAREVITPPPLRGPLEGELAHLTANGVFLFTNQHRIQNGAPVLARNARLDEAATNKMNDLFARQYFDHVSPTGEGPSDVVEGVGYEYIKVGENLALGNFPSDEALVQAWMDSPGHRENIVNTGYHEIGIAVGQGAFEGKQTWIGVQTFATPASACTMPSDAVKNTLDADQAKVDALQKELAAIKADLDRILNESRSKIEEGNAKIAEGNRIYKETGDQEAAQPYWDEGEALHAEGEQLQEDAQELRDAYNRKVDEINRFAKEVEELVKTYNQQVQLFNSCVESL